MLLPCPFCGRTDKLSLQHFPGCRHIKTVYCDACGAWGPGGSEDPERAADFWNQRDQGGPST
jgi:Lar family restriction alleviation protein